MLFYAAILHIEIMNLLIETYKLDINTINEVSIIIKYFL